MSTKTDILDQLYHALDNMDKLIEDLQGTSRPYAYYGERLVEHTLSVWKLLGKPEHYLQFLRDINALQGEMWPIASYGRGEDAQALRLLPKEDLLKRFDGYRLWLSGQIGIHLNGFVLMSEIPLRQSGKKYEAEDVRNVTRSSKLWEILPAELKRYAEDRYSPIKTFYLIEGQLLWMHMGGGAVFSGSEGLRWRDNNDIQVTEQAKTFFAHLVSTYDWHYLDHAIHDAQHQRDGHYIPPKVREQINKAFRPDKDKLAEILYGVRRGQA